MKKFLCIFIFLIFATEVFTENAKEVKKEESNLVTLTLDSAINMVIHKNLTLQSAKYDLLMTDTDLQNYLQKYSIRLNAEASYVDQKAPASGLSASFGGNESTQFDTTLSISKLFSTGTMISAGITESLYDQNDLAIPNIKPEEDPAYHKPSLFFSIQQEFLKNAFGYADRKNLEMLKNSAVIRKEALLFQLSGLIVSALVDYWQVIIEENGLKNSKKAFDATVEIRDIIGRNTKFGLADSFELNQYESLVAASKSRLALSQFQRDVAYQKLLRTINLPAETKIQGVTELDNLLPKMDLEAAIETAFKKRTDYQNLLREIEINELNAALANHNALPSLNAFFTLSTMGQSDEFGTATEDTFAFDYPTWKVGFKVSYPLFDTGVKTAIRNAEYKLEQSKIKLEDLRKEIINEVTQKYKAVKLQFEIMQNTTTVMRESQIYYEKIMQNAKRGRFNSIVVKNALDSIIDARQKVLESLVQYNIALLQYDLAKNEIFERFQVDINDLMKNLK
jgi:outer membrane protein TolC